MWKLMTEKGEKLPDLLVVLAITVVLAAILLPAVTSSHGNEVNAASGIQSDHAVMDGLVRPSTPSRAELRERDDTDSPTITDSMEETEVPVADASMEPPIAGMRTTDISYTLP